MAQVKLTEVPISSTPVSTNAIIEDNGSLKRYDLNKIKPIKGVDYWTEADQESIVQQIIAALGTPVFGRVDAENNIILTGNLVDGVYTLKFEDADGNVIVIGTLSHMSDSDITYINWIPLSTTTPDGTEIYNGKGYKENSRFSSSGNAVINADGIYVTGWIPASIGNVIRVKNVALNDSNVDGNSKLINIRHEDGTLESIQITAIGNQGNIVYDDKENIIQFTIPTSWSITHFRLNAAYIGPDSILTINEEIADNGGSDSNVTNVLKLAINSDGTLYNNGQGWKTGYRLNSSASETAETDMEVTGFIPITFGDTIHLKNIQWPVQSGASANKCYVTFYDSSFNSLGYIREIDDLSNSITIETITTNENGYLTKIDTDNSPHVAHMTTMAYFRISAYEITDNSIITLNEKIADNGDSGSIELLWTDSIKLDKNTGAESVCNHEYAASQHIELVDGYSYTFNQTNYGGVNICYYDAAGNGLGSELLWDGISEAKTKTLTPIAGAATFRVRLYYGLNTTIEEAKYRYSLTYEKTA